jgi:hypothetical protein
MRQIQTSTVRKIDVSTLLFSLFYYVDKGNWNIHQRNRFHHHNGSDSRKDTIIGDQYFVFSWFHRIIHYICVDWFHSLLYSPTPVILLVVFLLYVSVVLVFAALYLYLPKFFDKSHWNNDAISSSARACHMDMKNYLEAIYFSTSTMSTIGYGVSDYYFNDCIVPLVLILVQIFLSLAINAVAFGLLFLRLSTSRKRRRTLLFSNKAVIAQLQDDLYFMVRIAELATKRHLIQCQVKCYCVRHTRQDNASSMDPVTNENHMYYQHPAQQVDASTAIETNYFQVFDMKLQSEMHPSTFLLMALPIVIAHKIDSSSPLMPPAEWYDENGVAHSWDRDYGNKAVVVEESSMNNNNHRNDTEAHKTNTSFQRKRKEMEDFLCDRETEIVVIIEGIDEMTCSPLQAKQSYKFDHGDILWDHVFAPCVLSSKALASNGDRGSTKHCVVDYHKFHNVVPAKA